MKRMASGMLAFALLLGGCRGGGRNELLERELRMQEDRIYQLEAALDECDAMLNCSRRENDALKSGRPGADEDARSTTGGPALSPPADVAAPARTFGGDPPAPAGPNVELGRPSGPPSLNRNPSPPVRGSSIHRGDEDYETDDLDDRPIVDPKVARIVLIRQLTGGRSHHGGHADEGLTVVFEPRNAAGQLVRPLGDVSIVALDPKKRGGDARVARWDFTADEADAAFRRTAFGRGFYFELPWPSSPPTSDTLRIFVRLTTTDGAKFNADAVVRIDPPDRQANRWSPVPRSVLSDRKPPRSGSTTPVREELTLPGEESLAEPQNEAIEPAENPARRGVDSEISMPGVDDEPRVGAGPRLRGATRPRRPTWSPFR